MTFKSIPFGAFDSYQELTIECIWEGGGYPKISHQFCANPMMAIEANGGFKLSKPP